jgi:hypothetical protein
MPLALTLATFEHLVPRSRGGNDGAANLALACSHCNMWRDRGQRLRKRFTDKRLAELVRAAAERAEALAAVDQSKREARARAQEALYVLRERRSLALVRGAKA